MSQSSAQTADGKRKRRFKRQPEGFIQLTERDAAIIKAVYRHRFLRSTHILALFGGGQALLRRLAELYHHAYLDRPREQIEFYQNAGSKPMVYALGNKGADYLSHCEGVARGKVDWTAKNHTLGPLFLEHTLLVADFMVSMELACRRSERVRLIPAFEIVERSPEETRRRKKPLQWSVSCPYQGETVTLGVVPDGIFGLHYLDRPEGRNRAIFLPGSRPRHHAGHAQGRPANLVLSQDDRLLGDVEAGYPHESLRHQELPGTHGDQFARASQPSHRRQPRPQRRGGVEDVPVHRRGGAPRFGRSAHACVAQRPG